MPPSAPALLSYASLVAMISPLAALRLKPEFACGVLRQLELACHRVVELVFLMVTHSALRLELLPVSLPGES
jgi:hypothetical protein